jgi:hypothetical protein
MTTDRTTKSRWLFALWQLTIVSLSLVVIFALADWSLDALDLGGLQQRNGERVAGFLPFLYFSVETFFRIGCGIQTPVGLAWGNRHFRGNEPFPSRSGLYYSHGYSRLA